MNKRRRKLVIGNLPFLISDTVGFIRKLPTQLVESFKSTLDEVREADLLMHVIDITHSNFEEHKESVEKILLEKPISIAQICFTDLFYRFHRNENNYTILNSHHCKIKFL